MSEYEILGEMVTFSDAADRYWKVQYELWSRFDALGRTFDQWYSSRSVLRNPLDEVLIGCERKVEQMMEQYFVTPFFFLLSEFDINYFSTGEFRKQTLRLDYVRETLRVMADYIRNLPLGYDPKETEDALRTAATVRPRDGEAEPPVTFERPEGLGAYFPDSAAAPPVHTAPVSEYTRQKHLFELGGVYLHLALKNSFMDSVYSFVRLVNGEFPDCFSNDYDYSRSASLLAAAERHGQPDKKTLVKAFAACPWNLKIYDLAFAGFPEEQQHLYRLASNFHIDLTEEVLNSLEDMYEYRESDDEAELRKLRGQIQERMRRFNIKDTTVVDKLEMNLLGQICSGYESADRITCCQMELIVHKQDLAEKNKNIWMKRLQALLEVLSSSDQGVNFEDYLLKCQVLDPVAVADSLRYVEEECPEESKELFLQAFRTFSKDNIRSARVYYPISGDDFTSRFVRSWGYILAVIGLLLLTALEGWWMFLGGAVIAAGLLLEVYLAMARSLWNKMTLQGTVVHKVFTVDGERFRKMVEEVENQDGPGGVPMTKKGRYD